MKLYFSILWMKQCELTFCCYIQPIFCPMQMVSQQLLLIYRVITKLLALNTKGSPRDPSPESWRVILIYSALSGLPDMDSECILLE